MSADLRIYKTNDFIRKTKNGEVSLERSLEVVRRLGVAAAFYKGHDIVLDVRDTQGMLDMTELMTVAGEFIQHMAGFENKMAVLIPNVGRRIANALFFKNAVEIKGFQMEVFFSYEDAIEWLFDVTEIGSEEEKKTEERIQESGVRRQ